MSSAAGSAARGLRDEEQRADGQAHLEAQTPGADGALGRLLLIAYEAMEHGEWRRLKACRNDTCRWGFYDHSRDRSKTWCSMEVCESQVKSRAYRARERAGGATRVGSSPLALAPRGIDSAPRQMTCAASAAPGTKGDT